MHVRLPECRGAAGSFVRVWRGLQLRPDVHLPELQARERTPGGEPVVHADTGLLAVVGSACMTPALVLAWCLAGARSSRCSWTLSTNGSHVVRSCRTRMTRSSRTR